MSYVIIDPDLMGVAADELQGIGSTLAASNTAAAAPTTGVLAPATDTVSVRAAALLDAHAQQYQALSAQAEAFHDKFVQTLLAAKNAYADIEAENATAMQSSPDKIALIMGGTGDSTPDLKYMTAIDQAYLAQHYPGYTLVSLQTPEQFWPLTGTESFGQSVQQGVAILNDAVASQTAAGHQVLVVGYSQSATIATIEMRYLDALPATVRPPPNLLNFVLLADPNNPMGGILTKFIPGFGEFRFPTPLNSPYMTSLYTLQYDGVANFPLHPLWLPSDINALFGAFDTHATVPFLSPTQVATAISQHIGNMTYYFIPNANIPLLDPLRMIPILGDPLADVLQPFLRPIVDLGYGSPFAMPGIIPSLSPFTFAGSLGQGAAFGVASPLLGGLPSAGLPIASGF